MAYQTSINGGHRFRHAEGILTNLGEVGGDVAMLAELQVKLALVDAKESVARATLPAIGLAVAAIILVVSLPVLMIGLAFVLANALQISQGASLLITGGVVLLIAAVVAFLALRGFLKCFESFRRSREEFARNVSWIQTVLKQSTKPTSPARR